MEKSLERHGETWPRAVFIHFLAHFGTGLEKHGVGGLSAHSLSGAPGAARARAAQRANKAWAEGLGSAHDSHVVSMPLGTAPQGAAASGRGTGGEGEGDRGRGRERHLFSVHTNILIHIIIYSIDSLKTITYAC